MDATEQTSGENSPSEATLASDEMASGEGEF
jgi:hypothetical protein